MRDTELPVFWVCGASGAGKSVATWELFKTLTAEGTRAAYVDIDQLGMLYPAADDDPERHRLKVEALVAMMPGYAAAGAQILLVSGVVDPAVRSIMSNLNTDLTLVLLSPDSDTLRERICARGWTDGDADQAVAEDAALRSAAFVDARIMTTGLSVAQTVTQLRPHVRATAASSAHSTPVGAAADVGVVLVTGPRAAGSSTIGFGLASSRWRAGQRVGFLDMQQLGLIAGGDTTGFSCPSLPITQFATMHEFFSARGAELLVVSGHLGIDDRTVLRRALPSVQVTVVRLRADEPTFREHVRTRFAGSEARLAGDDLLGAEPQHQAAVVAAALAEQEVLNAFAEDDAVIDVTERMPADVVADVEQLLAVLSRGCGGRV